MAICEISGAIGEMKENLWGLDLEKMTRNLDKTVFSGAIAY